MTTTSLGSYFWKSLVLYSSFNGIPCNSYSIWGHNTVVCMNTIQCTSNTTDNCNCMGCGRSTSSTAMLFLTDTGVEQHTVLDHMGTHFCNRLFELSNIKSFGISVTSKVLCLAACSWGLRIAWRFCGRFRAARQWVFHSQKNTVHDCKGLKNCPEHSTLKQACVFYVSDPRVNEFLDKDQKQRCVHYCAVLLNLLEDNPGLVNKLTMSDDVYFHLIATVKRKNFCYQSREYPCELYPLIEFTEGRLVCSILSHRLGQVTLLRGQQVSKALRGSVNCFNRLYT